MGRTHIKLIGSSHIFMLSQSHPTKMGYIYKITNLINQKIYIGKTTDTIANRFSKHKYEAINCLEQISPLHSAMRKYGTNNFIIEEIEECNGDSLSEREKYWINFYNSYEDKDIGYNATTGGEGNPKYDRKQILSLWNEGYNQTEIANIIGCERHTISKYLKDVTTLEERLDKKRRNQSKNSQDYSQYEKEPFIELWQQGYSAKEISNILHCHEKTVAKRIKEVSTLEERRHRSGRKGTPVCKIDKDTGEILQKFPSVTAAAKYENCTDDTIRRMCKNRYKENKRTYTYIYEKEIKNYEN